MASSSSSLFIFFTLLLLTHFDPLIAEPTDQKTPLSLLMAIRASLDPYNLVLSSWSPNVTDPCDGSFEGIACSDNGQVVNISLQGKGISGQIPPQIGQLTSLSGLYLHFNQLHGVVPQEIANLTLLTDLYLNVNNLSGDIPPQIVHMSSLQVLQLCYNKFSGGIPSQLGFLKQLNVLALQSNQLSGAIPANLGNLMMLTRLDLSFNHLRGPIPVNVAGLPMLKVLDIRNNTLSGNVPLALKRLNEGFQYANNPDLCGISYSSLKLCSASGSNSNRPEPFASGTTHLPSKDLPESANVQQNERRSKTQNSIAIVIVIGLVIATAVGAIFAFSWYRRRKQKIANAFESGDSRLSNDQVRELCRRSPCTSPLINLEYSNGWDPLSKGQLGQCGQSSFSQEMFESFMYNLDEVESATQYFSETNLLGKSNFSAIYKGILRDGSVVAIKCISKTSCKSDETEFSKGLKLLTLLKHENILRLRGFCCSKSRGECFLIYDFVPNGNLLQYLDKNGKVLDWSIRTSIIKGIAKGIEYLHGNKGHKPGLVHRNISAEKVLIDHHYKPLLADCGLHKLFADDIVFSALKGSAAMGYLAPEYTTTGRFTEKSDVYAFGMIMFQILSGKCRVTQLNRNGAEISRFDDFIDANLIGKFNESEAAKLGKVALLCTHESPEQRPAIGTVMQELDSLISG